MSVHEDVDGIDGPFERAMEQAMREDARAAHDRKMRALFNDGCPAPLRLTGTINKPGLAGYWPELLNIHLELLGHVGQQHSATAKWMTWDGADRVEFHLTNASAVYLRTEPADPEQGATITFRLEHGQVWPMTLIKDLIPANLVPTNRLPETVRFQLQGTTETLKGPFDFNGELEISIDLAAVGHQAMDAMTNRGHVAKKGALSVRFRGAAGRRVAPKEG